jgi:hypothetical protein
MNMEYYYIALCLYVLVGISFYMTIKVIDEECPILVAVFAGPVVLWLLILNKLINIKIKTLVYILAWPTLNIVLHADDKEYKQLIQNKVDKWRSTNERFQN